MESGIAEDDGEFRALLARSARSIGSDDFREQVDRDYRALVAGRPVSEDVAFRRPGQVLAAERILEAVAAVAKVAPPELRIRRRDSRWRAVASRMLCRYGGLTQRAAAVLLGAKTGVAVSCQLRKLNQMMQSDEELNRAVHDLEQSLDRQQQRQSR